MCEVWKPREKRKSCSRRNREQLRHKRTKGKKGREGKNWRTNFLPTRERVVDWACLNCRSLKFTTKRLRSFLLWKLYNFETATKPSFEQHFWDISKVIFTVLKKSPQRRKASVEVGKLGFVFSHNNSVKQRVWEKIIVKSKANFVAWESYMVIVFQNGYCLAA